MRAAIGSGNDSRFQENEVIARVQVLAATLSTVRMPSDDFTIAALRALADVMKLGPGGVDEGTLRNAVRLHLDIW